MKQSNKKNFSRRRRSGNMRFRPGGGQQRRSKKADREAREARAVALKDGEIEENIFENRHEKEIRKAENVASGLPPEGNPTQNATEQAEEAAKEGGFRKPHLNVPAQVREDDPEFSPVTIQDPEPQNIVDSIKAAASKVVKKVQRIIRPKESSHKEVIMNVESLETRVAVLIDGHLEDFNIERTSDERLVGSIYKGRVRNLEDGLKAAFVDIGYEKNSFLHYWDIIPSNFDNSFEIVDRPNRRKERPKITTKDIPRLYPPGTDIIIQVTKGAIGSKGPRVTTNLVLPGRFLVLLPNSDQCGISRKISNQEERKRLKEILRDLSIPDGMGVIMRTAGEGQQKRYFVRDLAWLLDEWNKIQERIQKQPPATCVFQEPDLIERAVRDFLTEDVERIVLDNQPAHERVCDLVSRISKRSISKVKLYSEPQPIFDRFNISRQLQSAHSRQVTLKSGGYIVIDETEALVAIDINTGRHKSDKDVEQTLLKVNLEACDEICRQLRLRNIGGLIVVDFIDMRARKDQQQVYQRMRDLLKRDRAKTHILPISQLGLMEMTRQRHTESVRASVYDDCPQCRGRGKIKSSLSVSVEIQRKLSEILKKRSRDESDFQLKIVLHPSVLDRMHNEDEKFIIEMEKKYYGKISFKAEPDFRPEQFKIYNALTNQELVSIGG